MTLAQTGSITTYGAGAWGILAQSIGGGGGFAGDPSLPMPLPVSYASAPGGSGNAYANTVTVNVAGNITTTGTNAHGIFAQAIGGGGGIAADGGNSTAAVLIAGTAAGGTPTYLGDGAAINITQGPGSRINTSALGSTGIVAQSSGIPSSTYLATYPITVTIGGTVTGGTNGGMPVPNGFAGAAGILLSGGGQTPNPNTIMVNAGGAVGTADGVQGPAIASGYGMTNLSNSGTITGSINLWMLPGTITNNAGGVLNTGPTLVTAGLFNNGILNVGGARSIATTALTGGGISQSTTGTLAIDINSLAVQKADLLTVTSGALIQGTVAPVAVDLLPGTMTIFTAAGGLTTTAVTTSSLLVNWNLARTGNSLTLSPSLDSMPARVSLTSSQASLAGYVKNAWNNSDASFASTFGSPSQITSASTYITTLDAYSARATQALATAQVNTTGAVLGAALSCPVFVDTGTLLGEDSCVWAKLSGERTDQYADNGDAGYRVDGVTYRIGGQAEFAPDWYVGGSLSTGNTWSQTGSSSGSGQIYDGSLAVKHTIGPWLFAGSVALAGGTFENARLISLAGVGTTPGVDADLRSNSSIFIAGGRFRAAYDFAFDHWYVRPYGDLDVIYSNAPGFRESGPSAAARNVQSLSKTNVAVSPMLEFGGRFTTKDGITIRPYAAVGVSLMPNNTRAVAANFVGALAEDGTFQTFIRSPNVLGDVDVGVQVYRDRGFEVKAEYGLSAGGAYVSQTGRLRAAYHF